MTRTSGLHFGSDPTHLWDTKRELFNLAEVCALSSAVPLYSVLPSVTLSDFSFVCQSPTSHNSKPIIMKLYQVVEVVSTEKPFDFEVKGHLEVKFLKSFFIRLT